MTYEKLEPWVAQSNGRKFECMDCGKGPDAPMIKAEYWNLVGLGPRDLLCCSCLDLRLAPHGLDLRMTDLYTRCLMNQASLYVLAKLGL